MRTKTFASLVLLLLFCVISVPTIRPQTNDKAKESGKAVASDSEHSSQQDIKDNRSQNEPPRDGEEWFARGYQLHNSDRYAEAIESFKRAVDLGHRKATAMYNIACGYSLLNDKDNALTWLQRSLDNGFEQTGLLADDSDLDPLRTDARFQKILASLPLDHRQARSAKAEKDSGYPKLDRLEQANFDYARLERETSPNGEEWAKLGAKLLMLRELDRSIIALHKAVDQLDYKGDSARYNLACAYALKGDRDAGINWLEKAVNSGFDSPEKLRNDPDIKNLRSDARFARLEKLSSTLSLSQFYQDKDGSDHSNNSNYSKERWAPAVALYENFVTSDANSGRGWFNLGYALHYSREHTKAIGAFEHALALGYHKPTSIYNIACAYAMLNQKDAAFEWLDRALKAGFDSYGDLSWDRDLDNLRSDPRFKPFLANANYTTNMRKRK